MRIKQLANSFDALPKEEAQNVFGLLIQKLLYEACALQLKSAVNIIPEPHDEFGITASHGTDAGGVVVLDLPSTRDASA